MPASVVAGYDPETSDRAPVLFGVMLARCTGAPLTVVAVHAGRVGPLASAELPDELTPRSRHALDQLRRSPRDVTTYVRVIEERSGARGIHLALEREQAGLVVLGSSRRAPLGRVLPGSTAERVMSGAPCPVAIVPRGGDDGRPQVVGCALLPGPEGRAALDAAARLARSLDARLQVVAILHHTPSRAEARSLARLVSDEAPTGPAPLSRAIAEVTREARAEPAQVFVGDPVDALTRASRRVDLLVLGARTYGAGRAVLLGGVTRRVVAAARCPVLVLPRGDEAPLEDLMLERSGSAA